MKSKACSVRTGSKGEHYVVPWSRVHAGCTLACLPSGEVVQVHLTRVLCPNGTAQTWRQTCNHTCLPARTSPVIPDPNTPPPGLEGISCHTVPTLAPWLPGPSLLPLSKLLPPPSLPSGLPPWAMLLLCMLHSALAEPSLLLSGLLACGAGPLGVSSLLDRVPSGPRPLSDSHSSTCRHRHSVAMMLV